MTWGEAGAIHTQVFALCVNCSHLHLPQPSLSAALYATYTKTKTRSHCASTRSLQCSEARAKSASSTPRASWAVELQKGALPGNSNVTLFAGLNLGRADSVGRGVLLAEFLLSRSATKQSRAPMSSSVFFAGQPRSKSNHRSRANCVLVHMIQTRE